ncbi:MAG: bifunctional diaminohydroxyphosphoribosylaminopyrimidine deaminase/5-amino-6-(5-phosphoribosylamino)uracil reductase RibD, partial [Actinobacteria bacterium]|nr:bifunctional diaminohydroxyphosphoribosylaminopyrimidine deaminase/5-amino-6-(5-phosphoribosylamino)uracil reductase RibD [Actinomycetota bacterium]
MERVISNYKDIFSPSDIEHMSLAIKLAEKGRGKTSPNPMVGAVIVKENRVIGTGFHKKAGGPHAEIEAIRNSKEPLDGSTMYVTLEPCTIYGKTPPCVNQIVKHNFKEVVIGTKDPNPLINGKGIEFLKKRGVKVRVGLLEDKISTQNEVFFKHIRTKMPFVCCKIASTIDGKLATSSGNSKWITSEKSRRMVQKLRKEYGCILTGINTVVKDDPLLFPRKYIGSTDTDSFSDLPSDFYRVILDSNLKINLSSRVAKTSHKAKTIIFA